MTARTKTITILMADDDQDDCLLVREAFTEARISNDLRIVHDGKDLLDYLHHQGSFKKEEAPRPGLILLDLNMPRLDGRQALNRIKSDPELKRIPVVVLTTSREDQDILKSYSLGANSYITKPVTFEGLIEVMKELKRYWFEIVELPE
jgi:CheY-like chemotaxis protein